MTCHYTFFKDSLWNRHENINIREIVNNIYINYSMQYREVTKDISVRFRINYSPWYITPNK